mgnify:CR=1 FL=1
MLLISHRGNINGPDVESENHPNYIKNALLKGFHVEIDVWFQDDVFLLGHDYPAHKINEPFLENEKLWCHAKNLNALEKMLQNPKIHCFWHQEDDFSITSKGYIWTYPKKQTCSKSILVVKDNKDFKALNCFGICSDFLLI